MESDQTAPLLDPEERYAAAFAPLEDQFMDVLRELDHMEAGGSQHEPEVGHGGGKDRGWERQHPQQLSGGSTASCQHIPLCFSNVRVPVLAVSMSSGLAGAYSSVVINQTLRYAALA